MPTIFTTDRLDIRHLSWEQELPLYRMHANPQTMRYVGGTLTADQNRDDLQKILRHYEIKDFSFLVWGIFRSSDDAFVGTCALIINDDSEQEIGYRLARAHWGNGYGLEVTQGLITYAFIKLGIDTLVAYVDKANVPSVRILDRSPFLFDKEYYNEELKCTDRRYTLSKHDWSKLQR